MLGGGPWAALMLVCGGCGPAASPENAGETPGGGMDPSATAAPEKPTVDVGGVRTAQKQCEEGIIRCGYVVDTPEAFLETFELEQGSRPGLPGFPRRRSCPFHLL